ncbi:MAG: FtsX-like permease family protein [Acidobacteriota bacterium]
MTLSDTFQLALRNLGQAKLRTSLTTLGVSIGIASLAGMVSLGLGLQDQFVGRFTKSGVFDAVTVMSVGDQPGVAMRMGRRGSFGRARGGGPRGAGPRGDGGAPAQPDQPPPPLDDEAMKTLAALDHVKEVYPNLRVPVQLKYGGLSEFAIAAGVPMSARGEGAFQTFAYGSFFGSDSDRACLLSLDLAKRIEAANPGALIGRELILAHGAAASPGAVGGGIDVGGGAQVQAVDSACRIAGIVERDPAPGPLGGGRVSGVMIPLGWAKEIGDRPLAGVPGAPAPKRTYPSLTVKVMHPQATQDVEDRIKAMGFTAFSVNDALEGAKRAFIILDIVLSLIGSIALAVSSLGIVNTMVMSILERTREIGIMKAIGGSDGDIRRIFLIEASAIGLLGGVAGVLLGWLVGRAINIGANIYIQGQGGTPGNLFALPLWLIGGAIGFSIVVSLIAGSYPAARAARLDPIQALRHD